jgi:hypothetical protein
LLELGRELLIDELLPLLPESRHRELHLLATAIAITRREVGAGDGLADEIAHRLALCYGGAGAKSVVPAKAGTYPSDARPPAEVDPGLRRGDREEAVPADVYSARRPGGELLRRFAADLRNGAFETLGPRQNAARVILWALTIAKLREGNPQFLAANGIA